MHRLPAIYRDATLRNFTPVDRDRMRMGFGLDLSDERILRVALSVSDVEAFLIGAKDYLSLFHSTSANSMPGVDVSAPALRDAVLKLLALDLENDGATADWDALQVAIRACRDAIAGVPPNV